MSLHGVDVILGPGAFAGASNALDLQHYLFGLDGRTLPWRLPLGTLSHPTGVFASPQLFRRLLFGHGFRLGGWLPGSDNPFNQPAK
jgi:hypothetical protein